MTPIFPNFRQVALNDRKAVETFTSAYLPYSDFNFTSLWVWDTNDARQISLLNGNLVVRFTDYTTHEPFYSFLGTNEPEATARLLIDHAIASGVPPILRLVPDVCVNAIRKSVLNVEEDQDNFDYIYSVSEHVSFAGTPYKRHRNFVNAFTRDYVAAKVEVIDLANESAQSQIRSILKVWEENKVLKMEPYEIEHERAAIERLLSSAGTHDLTVLAVFVDDVICAFSIDEVLPNGYSITHFQKANTSYRGIYFFLLQHRARHLDTLGVTKINFEQDLGIPNLRKSKSGLRPIEYLKKYTVQFST